LSDFYQNWNLSKYFMTILSSVLGFTCGRTGLAKGMILIPRFEVLSLVLLKM